MSHRKQKLGFSMQKSRRVLFCWLELCQQLLLDGDSVGIMCSPEVFGVYPEISSPRLPAAPAGSQSLGAVAAQVGIACCCCIQITIFKKPQLQNSSCRELVFVMCYQHMKLKGEQISPFMNFAFELISMANFPLMRNLSGFCSSEVLI